MRSHRGSQAARLIFDKDCPPASDLALLQQVIGGNLSRFQVADPDVRASCNNRVIDILIWGNRVPADSCSELARKRARIPDDIAQGGNFGVYVSAGLIRRLAQNAFNAAPKRLYANGFAGADGPIHLTGLSVAFQAPNVVKTIITGYDERPWPDVGFTTTIADVLADLQALDRPDNPSDGGVGCRLMEGLPDQISLPETGGPPTTVSTGIMARRVDLGDVIPQPKKQKLVIPYNQPRVDDRGILASAFVSVADRIPAAAVNGPSALSLDLHAPSTYGYFGAHVEDFYGRLTFRWTASGSNVVISSPNTRSTKITFQRGNAKPGDSFERTVTVKVTDIEGSTVTASRIVTAFAAEPGDSPPPVCKVKPWLDVCSPGG